MATHDGVFTQAIMAGVTSLTTTNSAALPAGDFIAMACRVSGISATSVSDTANGTYTNADLDATNSKGSFYFQNSAGAASGGDTMTVSGTSGTIRIAGDFFGGIPPSGALLGHVNAAVTGVSVSTGNIATDSGGNVVWGCLITGNTSAGTFTAGTSNGQNATIGTSAAGANGGIATEYITSDAGGTQNLSMTESGGAVSGDDFFGFVIQAASQRLQTARAPLWI